MMTITGDAHESPVGRSGQYVSDVRRKTGCKPCQHLTLRVRK